MFDVVALGESLIDFTPNGTNAQGIELFARNPGGAPANVLAMNARLGGKTAFIGKVGKDGFGDFLRQTLVESSIDVSGLVIDEKIPTTLAFVQLDSKGDRSFTFYRNPGADVMLTSAEVNRNLIDDAAIFHFGSVSLTSDPSRTATLEAARYARQQGKLVSFDPNYRPLLWEHPADAVVQMQEGVKLADLLKVSEEEMQLITNESDLARGSQALLEMGPSLVLISLGARVLITGTLWAQGIFPPMMCLPWTRRVQAMLSWAQFTTSCGEKLRRICVPSLHLSLKKSSASAMQRAV